MQQDENSGLPSIEWPDFLSHPWPTTLQIIGNFNAVTSLYSESGLPKSFAESCRVPVSASLNGGQTNTIPCIVRMEDESYNVMSPRETWNLISTQINNDIFNLLTDDQKMEMRIALGLDVKLKNLKFCHKRVDAVADFLSFSAENLPRLKLTIYDKQASLASKSQPYKGVSAQLGIPILLHPNAVVPENAEDRVFNLVHLGVEYRALIYWFKITKKIDSSHEFSFNAPSGTVIPNNPVLNHDVNREIVTAQFVTSKNQTRFVCPTEMLKGIDNDDIQCDTNSVASFVKTGSKQKNYTQYDLYGPTVIGNYVTAIAKLMPPPANVAELFGVTEVTQNLTRKSSRRIVHNNLCEIENRERECEWLKGVLDQHCVTNTRGTEKRFLSTVKFMKTKDGQWLKRALQEQSNEMTLKQSTIDNLTSQLESSRKRIRELELENSVLTGEIENLQVKLDTQNVKLALLEKEMCAVKSSVDKLCRKRRHDAKKKLPA